MAGRYNPAEARGRHGEWTNGAPAVHSNIGGKTGSAAPGPVPTPREAQQYADYLPPGVRLSEASPAQPPAPASGADFSGAPGGNRRWTQADYDNYMASATTEDRSGEKLSKAIADGLLVDLGIGRPKARVRR